MKVLVGANTDGWHRTGLVAQLPNRQIVTAPSIATMVQHLRGLGISREEVLLAEADDGDRAMSTREQVAFWEAWSAGGAP